jgi:hypothetical protein
VIAEQYYSLSNYANIDYQSYLGVIFLSGQGSLMVMMAGPAP